MKNETSNRTFILLLSQEAAQDGLAIDWLKKNGFVAWQANDVAHAIEELSDFTVKKLPHVVLLRVPSLSTSFESLRGALRSCIGSSDIPVLAFEVRTSVSRDNPFFASDMRQLRTLIKREVGSPASSLL